MKYIVISVAKRKRTYLARALCWMVVVLYIGLIYMFSNQAGVESNTLSKGIVNMVRSYISLPAVVNTGRASHILDYNSMLRESAHFLEYFVLALLLYMTLNFCNIRVGRSIAITLVISLICACLDEFYQSMVPGRTPLIKDIVIDMSGGIFGLIFVYLINMIKNKFRTGVMR